MGKVHIRPTRELHDVDAGSLGTGPLAFTIHLSCHPTFRQDWFVAIRRNGGFPGASVEAESETHGAPPTHSQEDLHNSWTSKESIPGGSEGLLEFEGEYLSDTD